MKNTIARLIVKRLIKSHSIENHDIVNRSASVGFYGLLYHLSSPYEKLLFAILVKYCKYRITTLEIKF